VEVLPSAGITLTGGMQLSRTTLDERILQPRVSSALARVLAKCLLDYIRARLASVVYAGVLAKGD
jgi:hypothetical protein